MSMTRRLFLGTVAIAGLGVSACKKSDERKPTYPVSGKILLPDGKPAEHATVVFHPVGAAEAEVVKPHGKVGPDGAFSLSTYEQNDGAPEGEYHVTVELWLNSGRGDEGPSNRLNPRYGKPETSGLVARVEPAPTELRQFALKR